MVIALTINVVVKKGYCGTTSGYCSLGQGCQKDYGKCAEDRCGKLWGSCPKGQCCSKKGYCGTSSGYCSLAQGCQKDYGKCAEGRCGKLWGSCPEGQCCSKKGYCGTSKSYCLSSKGCQSDFVVGSSLASDSYFGNVRRAELFEKLDFKVPKMTINLSDEDYKNYFLTYKCEYDMNIRHITRNDDCYKAPWIDLDLAMDKAFKYNLINKSKVEKNDLDIINNKNITLEQFENIVTKYTNYNVETILSINFGLVKIPTYETENASITLDIDGEIHNASSVKMKIGGRSTTKYEKLGFNIKIKKGDLLGRKQLRLRTEVADPTFMREKLLYDMFNALEIPCLSLNYTTHLYECDGNYGSNHAYNCLNDDEDLRDTDVDFNNFIAKINQTKTKEELAEFFDVENYLKWQAIKYLIGGWDHGTGAQNQYIYRYHNTTSGKDIWIPLVYDFDNDFGGYGSTETDDSFDIAVYRFERKNPIYKILGINENASPEVISYMDQIMRSHFNPLDLFNRIEQLRTVLDPYVKEDRAFDAEGNRPGRLPRNFKRLKDYFSYEDFQNNIEYTSIDIVVYRGNDIEHKKVHGLKKWIIERFKFACKTFNLDCSYAKEFLDFDDYDPVLITREERHDGCNKTDNECCVLPNTEVIEVDGTGKWGVEFNSWCLIDERYPCCSSKNPKVEYVSQSRGVKYGIENGEWCGIIEDSVTTTTTTTTITSASTNIEECWSLVEGYPCCTEENPKVEYVSKSRGVKYGVENGEWCGIIENHTATTSN
ncbi:carbohydrate-binding module family 18 [Piromyces sp. E2]|nr:carbohydrate-binding module family 18 [Piromyces sp. E2]|eukprot:OUM65082.1 carbohydrate-binding module family 18 [Piromyces sp. E2]